MTTSAPSARKCPFHVPTELDQDFDILRNPGHTEDPYKALAMALEGKPRIFWSSTNPFSKQPGAWVLTRTEDMRTVLRNPKLFSSAENAGFSKLLGENWSLVPLEMDPPHHGAMRAWVNPLFASSVIPAMEPAIRETCVQLIEEFRSKGHCEFINEFGRPFPVTVILQLMGLPVSELPRFLEWEDELLHSEDMGVKAKAARQIKDYLVEQIADRRQKPRDDLFTKATIAEVGGAPLSEDEVLGFCYLMFVGGLDTVASSLGLHFQYLAEHPELQERLRKDPSLIPQAVEELLRRFSLVVSHRRATEDTELAGVQIKAGDWITIHTPASAIDETLHSDPYTVDIDRPNKAHLTFSFGAHTCLGMHLARRELIIALEEWTQRVPGFRIKPGAPLRTHAGPVYGVDELHLEWN
ncbi:cytochrome P450 [Pseudomonas sp. GM21]|uniref:cytochrome P450 n=1 Tax=Pseudomonas sp. GM21 TaxID=1144325 RepID=UPI00027258F1|nr:cytochrome P450 [Pseudomonas sp. GM21]EJM24350.1 cytochrome P450 [Pseudomonas sp. GM21]